MTETSKPTRGSWDADTQTPRGRVPPGHDSDQGGREAGPAVAGQRPEEAQRPQGTELWRGVGVGGAGQDQRRPAGPGQRRGQPDGPSRLLRPGRLPPQPRLAGPN